MTTSAIAAAMGSGSADPCHILVVEDLLLSQEIARSVLEAGGYTVSVAASGAEAIDAVRDRSYGLVLMDLNLPGLDGYATTALIRDMPDIGSRLPVVALTARGGEDEVERCRQAGMIGHVKKPFAPKALLDAIRGWAPSRQAEPRLPSAAPWDRVSFGLLADRLGPTRMDEALLLFRDSLLSMLDGLERRPLNFQEVDRGCHGLTSTAGMLGFPTLSAVSRSVMVAGSEFADATLVDDLRTAVDDVLLCLDERRPGPSARLPAPRRRVAEQLAV